MRDKSLPYRTNSRAEAVRRKRSLRGLKQSYFQNLRGRRKKSYYLSRKYAIIAELTEENEEVSKEEDMKKVTKKQIDQIFSEAQLTHDRARKAIVRFDKVNAEAEEGISRAEALIARIKGRPKLNV